MKAIRILFHLLLAGLLTMCSSKKDREIIGDYESYLEKSQIKLDSNALLSDSSLQSSAKQFQDHIGALSQADIDEIIQYELNEMVKYPGKSLKASGRAQTTDTTSKTRSCAAYDNADETTVKSFIGRKLLFPLVIPQEHHLRIAFHVIHDPAIGQVVTDEDLRRQVQVLNEAFRPIHLFFEIASVDRHPVADWYTASADIRNIGGAYQRYMQMTNELKRDPASYINIYINGMKDWGFGAFPWATTYQSALDCIIIKDLTLPGKNIGSISNHGKTLIHEMGHFLGLFHTFHSDQRDHNGNIYFCDLPLHDGCTTGDQVDDTPPQKSCHFRGCGDCHGGLGCEQCQNPQRCNTCDTDADDDPVKNFMGYNPDYCMDHFTPDQYTRMQRWFFLKRMYSISNSVNIFNR